MSAPVSVVIPALDDTALLERNLPPLAAELERRGAGDEITVVDDTGRGVLEPWLAARFPSVRAISLAHNVGFARALAAGVDAAHHELVLSLNPDVRVRPGFLEPLCARLAEPEVFAAAPRVLLRGEPDRVESWTRLALRSARVHAEQPGLDGGELPSGGAFPVAFAIGGACLMKRSMFDSIGRLDPLFEPFYFEDLDLCWRAWRAGLRVVCEPSSVVEHAHRGTIGQVARDELVLAAIEKNRALFEWKHLDTPELVREHLTALLREAHDAYLGDRREPLIWLAAAFEQLDEALRARAAQPEPIADFAELCRRSAS